MRMHNADYAIARYQSVCPSVCLSICLSYASTVSKLLNVSNFYSIEPHHSSFSTPNQI